MTDDKGTIRAQQPIEEDESSESENKPPQAILQFMKDIYPLDYEEQVERVKPPAPSPLQMKEDEEGAAKKAEPEQKAEGGGGMPSDLMPVAVQLEELWLAIDAGQHDEMLAVFRAEQKAAAEGGDKLALPPDLMTTLVAIVLPLSKLHFSMEQNRSVVEQNAADPQTVARKMSTEINLWIAYVKASMTLFPRNEVFLQYCLTVTQLLLEAQSALAKALTGGGMGKAEGEESGGGSLNETVVGWARQLIIHGGYLLQQLLMASMGSGAN